MDLGQVDKLQLGPSQYAELCADCHKEDVWIVNDDALIPVKHVELSNWKQNKVFEEVKDEGQKCISTRWLCTLKETPDVVVPKSQNSCKRF